MVVSLTYEDLAKAQREQKLEQLILEQLKLPQETVHTGNDLFDVCLSKALGIHYKIQLPHDTTVQKPVIPFSIMPQFDPYVYLLIRSFEQKLKPYLEHHQQLEKKHAALIESQQNTSDILKRVEEELQSYKLPAAEQKTNSQNNTEKGNVATETQKQQRAEELMIRKTNLIERLNVYEKEIPQIELKLIQLRNSEQTKELGRLTNALKRHMPEFEQAKNELAKYNIHPIESMPTLNSQEISFPTTASDNVEITNTPQKQEQPQHTKQNFVKYVAATLAGIIIGTTGTLFIQQNNVQKTQHAKESKKMPQEGIDYVIETELAGYLAKEKLHDNDTFQDYNVSIGHLVSMTYGVAFKKETKLIKEFALQLQDNIAFDLDGKTYYGMLLFEGPERDILTFVIQEPHTRIVLKPSPEFASQLESKLPLIVETYIIKPNADAESKFSPIFDKPDEIKLYAGEKFTKISYALYQLVSEDLRTSPRELILSGETPYTQPALLPKKR